MSSHTACKHCGNGVCGVKRFHPICDGDYKRCKQYEPIDDVKQDWHDQSICPSCNVPFIEHLGLIGTCANLTAAMNQLLETRRQLAFCQQQLRSIEDMANKEHARWMFSKSNDAHDLDGSVLIDILQEAEAVIFDDWNTGEEQ